MNALMDKIADKILPFAEVLSKNKYLAAIRNAFVTNYANYHLAAHYVHY